MGVLLLLLIHLSVFAKCDVANEEDSPTGDPLQVKIGGRSKLFVGQRSNFNCSIEGGIAPFEISFHEAGQNTTNQSTISVAGKDHEKNMILLCSVTDSSGATDKDYKFITVLAAPLQVEIEGQSNLEPGQSANYNCSIEGGESPFEISFQEVGQDIVNRSTISVTGKKHQEDILILCSVKDSLGATDKDYKTISVLDVLLHNLERVTSPNVQIANFTCNADIMGGNGTFEMSFNETGLDIINQSTIFITAKKNNETINVLYNVRDKTITYLAAPSIVRVEKMYNFSCNVEGGDVPFEIFFNEGGLEVINQETISVSVSHLRGDTFSTKNIFLLFKVKDKTISVSDTRTPMVQPLSLAVGSDSSMLIFNRDELYTRDGLEGWADWAERTQEFLDESYFKNGEADCKKDYNCIKKDKTITRPFFEFYSFDTNELGPCKGGKYATFGFDSGKPCILLKLKKEYGVTHEYFHNSTEAEKILGEELPYSLAQHIDSKGPDGKTPKYGEHVWVDCHGENAMDKEMLPADEIIYYPPTRGFSSIYFPYENAPGYQSPLVAVQFNNLNQGLLYHVECRAYAGNIKYDRNRRVGAARFQIIVHDHHTANELNCVKENNMCYKQMNRDVHLDVLSRAYIP